jgi:hypothetical protein
MVNGSGSAKIVDIYYEKDLTIPIKPLCTLGDPLPYIPGLGCTNLT